MRSSIVIAAFLAGLLVGIGLSGHAGDWNDHASSWLVLSGLAVHLDGAKHCNSTTTGIGYERTYTQAAYSVGVYRNSNCRWSSYAAKAWMPVSLGYTRLGLIGGLVTGYERPLTPVPGLALTYERKTWGLNLIGIPPTSSSSTGVLWLQAKYRFQ